MKTFEMSAILSIFGCLVLGRTGFNLWKIFTIRRCPQCDKYNTGEFIGIKITDLKTSMYPIDEEVGRGPFKRKVPQQAKIQTAGTFEYTYRCKDCHWVWYAEPIRRVVAGDEKRFYSMLTPETLWTNGKLSFESYGLIIVMIIHGMLDYFLN
jgi:hypothetical protein